MTPQNLQSLAEGEVESITSPERAEYAVPVPVPLRVGSDRGAEKGCGSNLNGDLQADLLSIGAWASVEYTSSIDGVDAYGRWLLHLSSLSAH